MSSHRSIPTVDRISALPDSVIYHILSFLPTKQSAATSILSKRWKPLWLSVLTLDFDYRDFADFTSFRLFVYYVMLTRDPASPIQSFRFKCGNSSGFNGHDVNLFIHSVVKRGIQNLNLDMSPSPVYFKLPQCVSSCSNLTVLKLKTLSISCLLDANFPLLKTLHLDRISFNGRRTTYFLKNLLNGCPALEYLRTYGLVQSGFKDEEFNCLLKLVEASISNSTILNIPFAWVCNAKFLFTRLKIPYCYQVPTFLNLTRMKIVFQLTNDWLGKWKWLIEVLQNCPKLQNLIIHEDSTYENEVGDGDCDWMDPPIVSKCLLSELRTCSLIGYEGMKSEFQFAEYILKNAKVLHTMTITASPVDINIKHQMLMKLSLCLRGSATCKLSFD